MLNVPIAASPAGATRPPEPTATEAAVTVPVPARVAVWPPSPSSITPLVVRLNDRALNVPELMRTASDVSTRVTDRLALRAWEAPAISTEELVPLRVTTRAAAPKVVLP